MRAGEGTCLQRPLLPSFGLGAASGRALWFPSEVVVPCGTGYTHTLRATATSTCDWTWSQRHLCQEDLSQYTQALLARRCGSPELPGYSSASSPQPQDRERDLKALWPPPKSSAQALQASGSPSSPALPDCSRWDRPKTAHCPPPRSVGHFFLFVALGLNPGVLHH